MRSDLADPRLFPERDFFTMQAFTSAPLGWYGALLRLRGEKQIALRWRPVTGGLCVHCYKAEGERHGNPRTVREIRQLVSQQGLTTKQAGG